VKVKGVVLRTAISLTSKLGWQSKDGLMGPLLVEVSQQVEASFWMARDG
jgi:hypothetical protein